jgi:hypothetical protein
MFAVLIAYSVTTVVIAQKKHRHVSLVDQNEAPSSNEKSTPPMGAPKAAATPGDSHDGTIFLFPF